MTEKAGKAAYEIFKAVMQQEPYHALASEYHEKLDSLQAQVSTFSKAQWQAIDEYLDASLKIHNVMIEIALKTSYSDSD